MRVEIHALDKEVPHGFSVEVWGKKLEEAVRSALRLETEEVLIFVGGKLLNK